MSIICLPAKLVFSPIPKVACTSTKVMLYEVSNAVEWRDARVGFGQVHGYPGYRSLPFSLDALAEYDSFAKFAIIRNPIDRAISAYRDKARELVLKGSKFEESLNKAGLPLEPDPELFFNEIDQYFECAPVIKEHMQAYSYHLGPDIGYYDRIFKLEDLDGLSDFVSERVGKAVVLQKSNSSQRSVNTAKAISEKTRQKVADFCSADLEYVSDYYDF